jgi:putative colanic acid biosynthesis acetyltransferase WcaF
MRNLSSFVTSISAKERVRAGIWRTVNLLVVNSIACPNFLRIFLLTLNGAEIGSRVIVRRGALIHFPWNLEIGDDCWIGEEVWFINHEKVKIGSNVCISQRSIICSGGHDYQSASLEYAHKPIEIKDGAWVCLDAKVLPGVTIGECSVVSAGEIVRKSVPDYSMLIAGEIRPIDPPK